MEIKAFYDARTSTLTYLVFDPATGDAVVIDPVLDYNPIGSKVWTESVDAMLAFVADRKLTLRFVLETHAHADHLSGSQAVKRAHPSAVLAVGARITEVQRVFRDFFDLPDEIPVDGSQFDRLLGDNEVVEAGSLSFEVIPTPGHTPACVTFKFGDALFTGDALFMPDQGTGRCDFPGGSADDLYTSVQRLYALPLETRVFVGHDYQPGGRELRYETTVGEQREQNVQLKAGDSREDFVARRKGRDATLNPPRLIFQSVQVNVDAGKLPGASGNERRYLKLPINAFVSEGEDKLELEEISR